MEQADLITFKQVVNSISPITDHDWELLEPSLQERTIAKNDFFAQAGTVCDCIGFVVQGSFQTYYIDQTGAQITTHLHLENSFIVVYESFITSGPSIFYIEALENAKILYYKKDIVQELFSVSKNWEKFGRIIAETVFIISQKRFQSLLLKTAEERYLELLKESPEIFQRVPQYLIASYLGIQPQSLSRIRKHLTQQ